MRSKAGGSRATPRRSVRAASGYLLVRDTPSLISSCDRPVHMLSKNFLAYHQLDIHLCTEFLYTFCRQHCPLQLVYR